ncbi:TonB-dependent receptor [Horticoccus sp. 23ND18S-11]|uniref:TonB-dependent receptor n=1 Tax=Horticoccus sp. 23ND18S-11 TaxID=3391832 RepID=UPI0039C9FA6A
MFRLPRLLCRTAAAFAFALSALAAAETATITGIVSNAATGRTLEGARVSLRGTDRETVTDGLGSYRLGPLPDGPVVLVISYTGLDAVEFPLTATAGATLRQDAKLTASIYKMGQFVVAGEREGNAQAVTLQRLSPGVKSVVSADAFGDLAGNPADLLVRLPGVEGEAVDGDIRYVRIRGMSQNLSSITINGNRAADAGSAGATREFQFEQNNADAIERMEVVKSPTPDMDGDSIGGSVNLVSKSAFDSSPDRRIRASLGSIWRPSDPREKDWPEPRSYSLSYSEVFAGRFGVAVNAGYRTFVSLLDQSSLSHQQLPNGTAGPAYTYSVGFEDARIERTRWALNLRLDYKLNDRVRFFLNGSLNASAEHKTDYLATYATNQSIATVGANGALTGTGGILPGFTDRFTAVRGVAASTVTLRPQYLNKMNDSSNLQLGAVHRYETVDLDYDVYKSFSETDYPGTREISFTARNVGFTITRADDPFFPYLVQTEGPDVTKIDSYTSNVYNNNQRNGQDRYRGAAASLTKRFTAPVPFFVKTGLRIREQDRMLRNTSWRASYVGPDGVQGVNPATGRNDDNLAQFGSGFPLPPTRLKRYPNLPYAQFPGQGRQGIDQIFASSPELFREDIVQNITTRANGNQDFNERISAGYLMSQVQLGKLSVLGGVRIEKTETDGEGALVTITPEERARRAAWVGAVTDAELRRRTLEEYSRRARSRGSYRDVLPGLHLKYTPTRNLVGRLSYSKNIGRPGIGELVPRTTVDDTDRDITATNPGLLPQIANNYDASIEYYLEPAGVVSVGVFQKDISRFIYTASGAIVGTGADNGFGGNYAGYELITSYNGGNAKVKGLELNYNQQLSFLRGPWAGLGVHATYTRMQSSGQYSNGGVLTSTNEVPGFNPFIANAGISYIRGRATLRLQYNYTGRYLRAYNANDSRLQYNIPRRTVDLRTRFNLSRRADLYLDVANIFNEPDSGSVFFGGRPRQIKRMSPLFSFGINSRL